MQTNAKGGTDVKKFKLQGAYDAIRDGNEMETRVSKLGGCAERSTGLGSEILGNGSFGILRTVKMEGKADSDLEGGLRVSLFGSEGHLTGHLNGQ